MGWAYTHGGATRRHLFALVPLVSVWAATAHCHNGRQRLVGILMANAEGDPEGKARIVTFREALRGAGWRDTDISIEVRWHGGSAERANALAKELADLSPDVLVGNGTQAVSALKATTSTIPIVFVVVHDPVAAGFVRNLSRPGSNITGFSTFEPAIAGKWVEVLTQAAPQIRRVGVLTDPDLRAFGDLWRAIEAAAPTFGLDPVELGAKDGSGLERAVADFAHQPFGGIIVLPTPLAASYRHRIFAITAETRTPAIYPFSYYAREGGLVSYGVDSGEIFRSAAPYVARILGGEAVGDLPVQGPTKFETVVNLKTARAMGLTIPPTLLARADEVIE
jgi:ABC-type uncharacterized transport system substrate-binding protein